MADTRLPGLLAQRVDGTAPKLLKAIGDYADGNGPEPAELVDVALAERFGWTFTELDEQDESRVLPSVLASNIYAALRRVNSWMEAAGRGANVPLPNDDDLRTVRYVTNAQGKTHA